MRLAFLLVAVIAAAGAAERFADGRPLVLAPKTARIEVAVDGGGALTARWDIARFAGDVVRGRADAPIEAAGAGAVAAEIDCTGLGIGEYRLRLGIERDGQRVAGGECPLIVAGPDDLFIVFAREPVARGIEAIPDHIGLKEIEVAGQKHHVMGLHWNSAPQGWWRSLRLNITDPRFQAGGMPVVDVAVTFRHLANAPLQLFADTARGGEQIGGGWGNNPNWQTIAVELDDARFARTDRKSPPEEMRPDGHDLRFNACTSDGEVRSVFVRGFERDRAPDFARLLRFDGLDAGRERFVFAPGEKPEVKLMLRNLANLDLKAAYRVRLTDDLGNELWQRDATATVPAKGVATALPIAFDTAGLKQGVYTLSLDLSAAGGASLLQKSVNLMVSESSPIARAAPGEFLYGLDIGFVDFADERWLQWARFMGADILRSSTNDAAALPGMLERLDRHGLTTAVMFDPPWDADPAARETRVEEMTAKAAGIARAFGDRIHYYELGNEPDLPFFYPGPIDAYVDAMTRMAQAIKRADPESCVMNGGLCFFPDDPRAKRFYEIVPAGVLDAFAYHGHGPLVGSERACFEKNTAEAAKHGKRDAHRFIETESGYQARTPQQLRVQARTAVEKMVYAQSVGMELFHWFRLSFPGGVGDGDYTNLIDAQQPRPVVLAYRTMVKTLRGHRFARRVDLAGFAGEAYLFANGDDGRVLVLWADHIAGSRTLRLAGAAGAIADCRRIDLFGNAEPRADAAGALTVAIDADPQFIAWRTSEPDHVVAVEASPLALAPSVNLAAKGEDAVRVRVVNRSAVTLAGELTIASIGIGVSGVAPVAINVPAGAEREVMLPARIARQSSGVTWPRRWTAFIDPGEVELSALRAIPRELGGVKARSVTLAGDTIDLAAIAGGHREKRVAILMAEIGSEQARTARVGASADWWMAWHAGGAPVFDTLAHGNGGGYAVTDHRFDLPLARGRTLIVVRVLSGSGGWKILMAGPDELAAAERGAGDRLAVELRVGGALAAREEAAIHWRAVVPKLAGRWDEAATTLDPALPDGEFGEVVVNDQDKHPDSTRWWQGPHDLSGRFWLRADATKLYLAVAVRDDAHRPAGSATVARGDAVMVALAGDDGAVMRIALPGAGGALRDGATLKGASAVVRRDADAGTTWYRLALDRAALPSTRLALAVQAIDADAEALKQTSASAPGFAEGATATWRHVVIE